MFLVLGSGIEKVNDSLIVLDTFELMILVVL